MQFRNPRPDKKSEQGRKIRGVASAKILGTTALSLLTTSVRFTPPPALSSTRFQRQHLSLRWRDRNAVAPTTALAARIRPETVEDRLLPSTASRPRRHDQINKKQLSLSRSPSRSVHDPKMSPSQGPSTSSSRPRRLPRSRRKRPPMRLAAPKRKLRSSCARSRRNSKRARAYRRKGRLHNHQPFSSSHPSPRTPSRSWQAPTNDFCTVSRRRWSPVAAMQMHLRPRMHRLPLTSR